MSVIEISPEQLLTSVRELLAFVEDFAPFTREILNLIDPNHREDALNLKHYLGLRSLDLRDLQWQLSRLGLSSLGHSEGFVRENLQQVIQRLEGKLGHSSMIGPDLAEFALHKNTVALMGARPNNRHVYIMVTASVDPLPTKNQLVGLIRAGMNCLRINGAHGTESDWDEIIRQLSLAEAETNTKCRILMDLPGPKIRTSVVGKINQHAIIKPEKNELGEVQHPAKITITAAEGNGLQVTPGFFSEFEPGKKIKFRDCRGKKRCWIIQSVEDGKATVLVDQTTYLDETSVLKMGKTKRSKIIGGWPHCEPWLDVKEESEILLQKGFHKPNSPTNELSLFCTLPEALINLAVGHRVLIDDGKISAVVINEFSDAYQLKITSTQKPIVKIRSEKGINLPDTKIDISAITEVDLQIFEYAKKRADIIALSFVRSPEDIQGILEKLESLPDMGLVIKVETQLAFANLPSILLQLMRRNPVGIMIARGDLAVECGFERLAELQEEILWLCEAARLPCIWATQVLEGMAHSKLPSRAEITDAAMAVRAEVVMLNKGNHIEEAVRTLSDVLCRMELHQYKKKSLFRPLKVAIF